MKIIHIESGLGNQMLSYCEYLAMKLANPNDDVYIETIIYDIPECNEVICQWSGYELERIFGIKAPNIKTLFSESEWKNIIKEIHDTYFWKKNWNYPVYITSVLNSHGLDLKNIRGDFEKISADMMCGLKEKSAIEKIKHKVKHNDFVIKLMYILNSFRKIPEIKDNSDFLFPSSNDNLYTGQWLFFKLKGYGIEKIEKEIRTTFNFPPLTDKKNIQTLEYIKSNNSVAIHARRGDMMGTNYSIYINGYFKRAVNYIKKHTIKPIFFIFCDPDSIQWAKDNYKILGLDFNRDEIHFIDWNKSEYSYIDLQLMSACKHQIITHSSFGWWAAWLNTNPNKITCSPSYRFNTTHHF